MFRRKKKTDDTSVPPPSPEVVPAPVEEGPAEPVATETAAPETAAESATVEITATTPVEASSSKVARGNRVQKVGIVSSDKMQKTVVVRVDRLVLHPKYRRYVRRTSKFMAHDDLGATAGDRVRIVETRPLSAKKRWRVVEIVQKAAK